MNVPGVKQLCQGCKDYKECTHFLVTIKNSTISYNALCYDCINRDEKDFKDRTLWLVLLIVGIFCGYSGILSIVYYFAVKKKLDK